MIKNILNVFIHDHFDVMAKGHKRSKHLKSEKAKIKLKSKTNRLPKNLNATNTSFKARKIVIREQLKHHDETEILSTRKLNIKVYKIIHLNINCINTACFS